MLSNYDLRKKIKKANILFYPFIEDNIEDANICVTASKYAWSLEEKKKNEKDKNEEGKHEYRFEDNDNRICIPAKECVLIFTNEVIFVGDKLAGECIPRVNIISRGLSYDGGPMKPERADILRIPIYNQTKRTLYIKENDRIAVLMFHELSSRDKSNKGGDKKNKSERDDDGIDEFLKKCENRKRVEELNEMRKSLKDKTSILKKLEEPDCPEKQESAYTTFRKENKITRGKIIRNIFSVLLTVFPIVLLIRAVCKVIKGELALEELLIAFFSITAVFPLTRLIEKIKKG